jgi:L-malate glycosyltransferase
MGAPRARFPLRKAVKIAFISTVLGYPWGGADTLWTHAAEAAVRRGDTVFLSVSSAVAAHPRIMALVQQRAAVQTRTPPVAAVSRGARLLRKLGLAPSSDAGLIGALRKFRPDLVIVSQGGTYDLVLHPALIAWLCSNRVKYRVVANWQQEHPELNETNLAFIRGAFAGANSVDFVSTRNLRVTRQHLETPLPNARVIQNPLRWQTGDITPWPSGPTLQLATVSRLEEGKGIPLLLQALAKVGGASPEWRLNIFGQGSCESRWREQARQLGLGERVQFRGYVPQLGAIWAANHLLVSPALEDGVPMTIPEAMLCQRPVLATCVGGAEDWLTHGRTGFLCPLPEIDHLVTTLQETFAARDRWEAMGRAAAVAATDRYQPNDHLLLIN